MARKILGIDPGTQRVGWAVLEEQADSKASYVASGQWRLGDSRVPLLDRLMKLHQNVQAVLADYRPELLALEAAFLGKNVRSALRLGEARGVIMVNARLAGVELLELPPAQVKRRVAGAGAASKGQIAQLVAMQLEIDNNFASEDESDALAVALCGLLECSAMQVRERSATSPFSAVRGTPLPPGASLQ